MSRPFSPYKETLNSFPRIIFRHTFLFVNGVIFSVAGFLYYFHSTEPAIFLVAMTVINMLMGIVQDTRAKYSLEKLQLITALKFTRIKEDKTEEFIYSEDINKGDKIKLKLGDSVPCDSVILESKNLEVSKALITGESDSFFKKGGEELLAGELIIAGFGIIEVKSEYEKSRLAGMTKNIKALSTKESPIQKSVGVIIKYSGFVLAGVILLVLFRGYIKGESAVSIVNQIGALASAIIPQGLVVITTLMFAFGAASYSSRKVLFQEINATEKLGRIKNLCMDKTGTLTDTALKVENMHVGENFKDQDVKALTGLYIRGSGDSSKTVDTLSDYVGDPDSYADILQSIPFSSERQYGVVRIKKNGDEMNIFLGPPEIFMLRISDSKEKEILEKIVLENTKEGKRVISLFASSDAVFPRDLKEVNLSVVVSFVITAELRVGIRDAISFFQERDVKIRVITGDNPETAVFVARSAGIKESEKVITGKELDSWTEEDYKNSTKEYRVFARIVPEQKVKIIEALKLDGFTAMVGDGANDALAIKNSDLGIAMFDGVPATRRLASVILMNNSFTALPGAVTLADHFICNIEMLASLFMNQSFLGFFLFVVIGILGYSFPLLPLNITVTNYFVIGLPGVLISYWALKSLEKIKPSNTKSFIKKVLPFPAISSVLQAIFISIVFLLNPLYLRMNGSNITVIIFIIIFGFIFFFSAPKIYLGFFSKLQRNHFVYLFIVEILLLTLILKLNFAIKFFSLRTINFSEISNVGYMVMSLVILGFIFAQYRISKYFQSKNT